MFYNAMTSIQETVKEEGLAQSKTPTVPSDKKSDSHQGFSSLYHNRSDEFQKHAEKTITSRCELFGTAYLENIRLCKNIADAAFDIQNNYLAKMGLRVDHPQMYEDIFSKYCNAASDLYSTQTRAIESILNMTTQNLKTTNNSLTGFSDLILSNYLWWIPPNKRA